MVSSKVINSGVLSPSKISIRLNTLPQYRLFVFFAIAAVISRFIFMFYTNRIWEDSLIALSSARNFWDGYGLTHHASEPYVQSFSSVIGELIMIAGEFAHKGILAIQLTSIVASVVSIYFAYRIGLLLSFNRVAHILVLSYLAFDHLQIFFGMAGMETQVVTAILLANAYFYLSSKWLMLGFAMGLAILSRPEFMLWPAIIFVAVLVRNRQEFGKVFIPALVVASPWFIFSLWYFGTITPHTVIAKSIVYQRTPFAPVPEIIQFCFDWWKHIAPFKQYWAVDITPIPDFALKSIVLFLTTFALVGALRAIAINKRFLPIVIFLLGFVIYITLTANGPYSMWYLPPFMALFFILAGSGVSGLSIRSRNVVKPLALLIAFSYAAILPFVLPIDKCVQKEIEIGIRSEVGSTLNNLMEHNDSVVLEPLGYIGWSIRDRRIYDYPGLSSPIALEALKRNPGTGLGGMMLSLSPTFAVLRPDVLRDVVLYYPETAASYFVVKHISLKNNIDLSHWGVSYKLIDNEFYILKLKEKNK